MNDPNLLEFWGNYLIAVARGQKQLQDINRWVRQNFQGMDDLANMFRQAYGLDQYPAGSQAYQDAWKSATAEFRHSFREMFAHLGWVPEEDYRELAENNQRLKQKVEEQARTIAALRSLLDEKGLDQTKTIDALRDLIRKQGIEFEKLMQAFSTATPPKRNLD